MVGVAKGAFGLWLGLGLVLGLKLATLTYSFINHCLTVAIFGMLTSTLVNNGFITTLIS